MFKFRIELVISFKILINIDYFEITDEILDEVINEVPNEIHKKNLDFIN